MASYLPVLLVSVNANITPDDTVLVNAPCGQVDYLSHDWQEEDVWRSWRNMTRQKNEIQNGLRLENASWRTWWKQRNKLKTVSPETLNWSVPLLSFSVSAYSFQGSKTQTSPGSTAPFTPPSTGLPPRSQPLFPTRSTSLTTLISTRLPVDPSPHARNPSSSIAVSLNSFP